MESKKEKMIDIQTSGNDQQLMTNGRQTHHPRRRARSKGTFLRGSVAPRDCHAKPKAVLCK